MFITEGIKMMLTTPWLAGIGLVVTYSLLTNPRFPAMFVLLVLGAAAAYFLIPVLAPKLSAIRPALRLPAFTFARMNWQDFPLARSSWPSPRSL